MKLTYQQMIDLQTMNVLEQDREPVNMYHALMTAPGLPVDAAMRMRTIRVRIEEAMKLFFEQRDAILEKYAVESNEAGSTLVEIEDKEPAEGATGDRAAEATREIERLLLVEKEGIPALKASSLMSATGRAAQLLVEADALSHLQPIILDDLDKAK